MNIQVKDTNERRWIIEMSDEEACDFVAMSMNAAFGSNMALTALEVIMTSLMVGLADTTAEWQQVRKQHPLLAGICESRARLMPFEPQPTKEEAL